MGNISAWGMNGNWSEWLHPDVLINYGGEYLKLVHQPEQFESPIWSCCVCGKRLQNVSCSSSETLHFVPHILVQYYPRRPSNRNLERRYCIGCRRNPEIKIQEEVEGIPEIEEERVQREENPSSLQDPAEVLALKGICIVPVFCIRCRELLFTEEGTRGTLLCPNCMNALQPGEALVDVGFYCTICGKQKEPHIVEQQRKMVAGRTLYKLCWEHCFFYTRERERMRQAMRTKLRNDLAVCMTQGYSVEECRPLRDALAQIDSDTF